MIDHAAAAVARLAQFLRGKPNAVKVIEVFAAEAQAVEVMLQDLLSLRTLESATDAALDTIGAIVGQPREGMSDSDYRAHIVARVKLNNGSGTSEELYTLLGLLKPTDTVMVIRDEPPAGFTLQIYGTGSAVVTSAQAATLVKFLRLARAAGVRGILEWNEEPMTDTFTLDGTAAQALDTGLLAGAAV